MGNVFVMAGVPKIMNAMMEDVARRLTRGVPMQSRTVEFRGGEGDAAKPLGEIQKAFPTVVIGSYPFQAAASTDPKSILHGIAKNPAPGKGWGSTKMQIKKETACGMDVGWKTICKNPVCSVCSVEASTEFALVMMMKRI